MSLLIANAVPRWTSVMFAPRVPLTSWAMLHTRAMSKSDRRKVDKYKAIVVGAGPAGIAVVGNLLNNGVKPIAWIDDGFESGRLNSYREVPSNTKAKLFLSFADALEPFQKITSVKSPTGEPTAYENLEALAQDKGCQLSNAVDLCLQLTKGLSLLDEVDMIKGTAKSAAHYVHEPPSWKLEFVAEKRKIMARRLVLCTGSHPKPPQLPKTYSDLVALHLDTALSPTALAAYFPDTSKPTTVALVGASHSAILVLRNLYNLASSTHPNLSIKWFSRHPLRYAEDRGDWILRDNTGLKGEAAVWAKEQLEPAVFADSPVSKHVEAIDCQADESGMYAQHLPDCDVIVEAVGFKPNKSIKIRVGKTQLQLSHDADNGGFKDQRGIVVEGLYGAGIAFPERVTDPEDNVEYAVGMWKFMKFLKRVTPGWRPCGKNEDIRYKGKKRY